MTELEVLENIGTAAVKRLRKTKLSGGKPFMINSDDLSSGQIYLEYPAGTQARLSLREVSYYDTKSPRV